MLPDFVIIGAMKAASTLVTECLRQHPEVHMPRGETHYFRDPEHAESGIEVVERVFTGTEGVRRRGIKCPDYLGEPHCDERIHAELGGPQLICVLRNPVDRAVSAYFWAMRWGVLPVVEVESGLRDLLDGGPSANPVGYRMVVDWGRYGEHLGRYLRRWRRDDLLVQLDEDYRRDGRAAIREVFDFLGVDPGVDPAALRSVQNEGVYSLDRLRWLNRRNGVATTWAPDHSWVKLARPTSPLPLAWNSTVVLADRHVLARRHGNAKPRISDGLRARLVELYAEDVTRTSELVGRDLTSWAAAPGLGSGTSAGPGGR